MTKRSVNGRNIFYLVLPISLLLFTFLAIRPLPKASKNNCIHHAGVVSDVLKGEGKGDIVIAIKNSKNYFYINRAIDNGQSVEALKEKLLDKEVELLTISHWTPLDPTSKVKHIAEIKTGGKLIYTEL